MERQSFRILFTTRRAISIPTDLREAQKTFFPQTFLRERKLHEKLPPSLGTNEAEIQTRVGEQEEKEKEWFDIS